MSPSSMHIFELFIGYILVSLHEISIHSVQPLYGPISGGTRVTISGQFLSVSSVTAVHIGRYILKPDTSRL